MSELTTLIKAYPPSKLDAELRADPFWASFCMLYQVPSQIAGVCDYFGLATVADALRFAGDLNTGLGPWRDKLAAWLNPSPGVQPADLQAAPWKTVADAVLAGLQGRTHAQFVLEPWDGTLLLPTQEQLTRVMAACPARRFQWTETTLDCDDQTRILRGWLSEHGLGSMAIGFCAYRAYRGDVDIGGHMVGLAVTADLQVRLCEPRDGRVYPITTTTLGGLLATRIAVQRAIF